MNNPNCAAKTRTTMAVISFYLDQRQARKGSAAPLKMAVSKGGKTVFISLNIKLAPNQWDVKSKRVLRCHPSWQAINRMMDGKRLAAEDIMVKLMDSGEYRRLDATGLRDVIRAELFDDEVALDEKRMRTMFWWRFLNFSERKTGRTKGIYMATYRRMSAFMGGESKLKKLEWGDINRDWLTKFDLFLSGNAPSRNARNIHLRNIRAVFNDAIDDEITTAYPFRRFKIRPMATAKRALSVDQLRRIFNAEVKDYQQKYLDMFKLTFFLIGINTVDLCRLKDVMNGRVEYNRAKTGRLYSIKVEPEAMELIERYRGKEHLLYMMDAVKDYRCYYLRWNNNISEIGRKVCPELSANVTTYWARHTWATVAAELDIPKETIAAALGHGGNTVTDIYIKFDNRKVDEANRRVMDYVLYDKQ